MQISTEDSEFPLSMGDSDTIRNIKMYNYKHQNISTSRTGVSMMGISFKISIVTIKEVHQNTGLMDCINTPKSQNQDY